MIELKLILSSELKDAQFILLKKEKILLKLLNLIINLFKPVKKDEELLFRSLV